MRLSKKVIFIACTITTAIAVVIVAYILISRGVYLNRLNKQQAELKELISATMSPTYEETIEADDANSEEDDTETITYTMLSEYQALYEENNDYIGWLYIEDTEIDYPVMQTLDDQEYYIYKDFYGEYNINGTLFANINCVVGVGTAEYEYKDGVAPTTNLIIYGHTMKSGAMFGNLSLYEDEEYGEEHNIICFDTLYEKREYELIAAFYTQVYNAEDEVFKYYKFFQADTEEEFDYWCENIKDLALYDTGVTAEFGDEFITLSCCSYQVEDGRFVVVGKRIA